MDALLNILAKADIHILKEIKDIVDTKYVEKVNEVRELSFTEDINRFVTHNDALFPDSGDVEYQGILSDLEKLRLDGNLKADKKVKNTPSNVWLTTTNEPYTWMSKSGPIVNHPKQLNDSSHIKKLMDRLNSGQGLDLNSCLVAYYANGTVNARLHADDEGSLDHSHPICILSTGNERTVEFLRKPQRHNEDPIYTINLKPGSPYSMLPGCQSYFKHRVPPCKNAGPRFSISFRRLKTLEPLCHTSKAKSPVKEMISLFNNKGDDADSILSETQSRVNRVSDSQPIQQLPKSKPYISVIFGTSITKKLDPIKLGTGNRRVINLSKSGATINDISKSVDLFFEDLSNVPSDIEKIMFSLGTNDIRHRRGVSKFRKPLLDLIIKTKTYFPQAKIYFQAVLPIRLNTNFTAENFTTFNKMLLDLCISEKCYFLDIFYGFLDCHFYDINMYFYNSDGIHLNHRGIVKLAQYMRYAINRDKFNPLVLN